MENPNKKLVICTDDYQVVIIIQPAYQHILFKNDHEYFESCGIEDDVLGEIYEVCNDGALESVMEAQFSLFRDCTMPSNRKMITDDNGVLIYTGDLTTAMKFYNEVCTPLLTISVMVRETM